MKNQWYLSAKRNVARCLLVTALLTGGACGKAPVEPGGTTAPSKKSVTVFAFGKTVLSFENWRRVLLRCQQQKSKEAPQWLFRYQRPISKDEIELPMRCQKSGLTDKSTIARDIMMNTNATSFGAWDSPTCNSPRDESNYYYDMWFAAREKYDESPRVNETLMKNLLAGLKISIVSANKEKSGDKNLKDEEEPADLKVSSCQLGVDLPSTISGDRILFVLDNTDRCQLFDSESSEKVKVVLTNEYAVQKKVVLRSLVKKWNNPALQEDKKWEEVFPETALITGQLLGPAQLKPNE